MYTPTLAHANFFSDFVLYPRHDVLSVVFASTGSFLDIHLHLFFVEIAGVDRHCCRCADVFFVFAPFALEIQAVRIAA